MKRNNDSQQIVGAFILPVADRIFLIAKILPDGTLKVSCPF
jgi:hypothetical protein